MNEVIKMLNEHTSIRKFNDNEITEEQIDLIINAAMRGATAGNMMYYSIIKIQSKDTLLKLSKSCDNQPFIENASLALLFIVDNYKWDKYFEQRQIKQIFNDYEGPVISDFILGMQDAMIAAQNAVIAAESLGIGTCYIGDIMENCEFHKKLFSLPKYTMPATLIVMGNYDTKPQIRERFGKPFIVFDEAYPKINNDFIDDMFASNEKSNFKFAEKFYARKKDSPFSKELIRSIKYYLNDWFEKK
ncbi:MAG: nitroreductase family protein [Sedimentibacter sp.]